ncbi:MAG TPA: hypothetical protein VF017_03280 [Thermoanaerobaculia bacterium]|nr:hypothetical protein [Thermoanaerobaculia bacterium]
MCHGRLALGFLALSGLALACARVSPSEPLPAGPPALSGGTDGVGPVPARRVLGAAWERALTRTQFPPRDGHAAVVFEDRLWLLGGWGTGPLADVWSSADGLEWREELREAPWPARRGHAAAVFAGKMWIFGGSLGADQAGDVWASPDGRSWERITAQAPWGPRNEHAVVVYRDRLFLLGGWSGGNRCDVWSSADGKAWRREVAEAPWAGRNSLAAASFRGRLWVLGGWGLRSDGREGNLGDAWSSTDGATWQAAAGQPAWAPRNGHTATVFRDRLWLLGGWADRGGGSGQVLEGNVNDVWSTADGLAWGPVTSRASWLPRNGHTAAVFRDQLWVLAGWSHNIGGTSINDLWHTLGPEGGR